MRSILPGDATETHDLRLIEVFVDGIDAIARNLLANAGAYSDVPLSKFHFIFISFYLYFLLIYNPYSPPAFVGTFVGT